MYDQIVCGTPVNKLKVKSTIFRGRAKSNTLNRKLILPKKIA